MEKNRLAGKLGGRETNDKRQANRGTDSARKELETKERVTKQWEVYAVCQYKESKMSVFVPHQ